MSRPWSSGGGGLGGCGLGDCQNTECLVRVDGVICLDLVLNGQVVNYSGYGL